MILTRRDLEFQALGCLLMDSSAMMDVSGALTGCFVFGSFPRIWEEMRRQYVEHGHYDLVTLSGIDDNTLQQMAAEVVSSAGLHRYVQELVRLRRLRGVHDLTTSIRRRLDLESDLDPDQLIAEAESQLLDLMAQRQDSQTRHIREVMQSEAEAIERRQKGQKMEGIPTGIKALDELLGGQRNGHLLYVAGNPKMGKTKFAISMAVRAAYLGRKVLFMSGEMPEAELRQCILALVSGLSSKRFNDHNLTRKEIEAIGHKILELSQKNIWINDDGGMSPEQMYLESKRVKAKHGLDYMVVDYIQIYADNTPKIGGDEYKAVSHASTILRRLKKELDIPVLALAQLSRENQKRPDPIPKVSDLRGSGKLEQDADGIIFLHRDYVYDNTKPKHKGLVILARYRHGNVGCADVYFDGATSQWRDWTDGDEANSFTEGSGK